MGACRMTRQQDQLAMQDFSATATGPKHTVVHAGCFQIWDAERLFLFPPRDTARGSGDDIVTP
jgi:hypothetical protein